VVASLFDAQLPWLPNMRISGIMMRTNQEGVPWDEKTHVKLPAMEFGDAEG
jgi:hypothetical protein